MKRYFEFIGSDGKTDVDHSKFWEIWVDGTTLRTRYGKIGATGQTTLKNFDTVSDAEAAQLKAIAEKTRKGYTEPSAEQLEEVKTNSASQIDVTEIPEVKADMALFTKWAKKYKPVAYVKVDLQELPGEISNEHIWTEFTSYESDYLSPGFTPFDDTAINGYAITSVPFTSKAQFDSVTTMSNYFCESCDGEGEIGSEECTACEGEGNICVEVSEEYPLVISTQKELEAFTAASSQTPTTPKTTTSNGAKFCGECGNKREPLSAKFCGECGKAF